MFEDRDRLARDLHDTVIQHLFAVGLSLQSMVAAASNTGLGPRLQAAVSNIDNTIQQIRTTIYELGLAEADEGVRSELLSLVRELEPVVGFGVEVSFVGPVDTALPTDMTEHLLAAVRETLTNVGRHANANAATLTLGVAGRMCRLQVVDNGVGMDHLAGTRGGGLGLNNLRHRAEKLRANSSWRAPLTAAHRSPGRYPRSSESR